LVGKEGEQYGKMQRLTSSDVVWVADVSSCGVDRWWCLVSHGLLTLEGDGLGGIG